MNFKACINPNIIRCRILQTAPYENFRKDGSYIFIHIPKAAGTSISKALGLRETAHARWVDYARYLGSRGVGRYFVFTFVRNPWARFFSLYNYSRLLRSYYHSNVEGEKSLFGKHCDYDLLKNATLLECAHYLLEGRLQHDRNWNQWLPQVTWLKNYRGEIAADFVGKVESLSSDFKNAVEIGKLPISSPLSHSNKSVDENYRSVFDNETKRIVASYYSEDIDFFKYQF